MNQDDLIDWRLPSASELGVLVKSFRQANKWTQATLAEIANVTERTIQRVERGEPSSLDTRRAICRAFDFKDLDMFDKPLPSPNVEKWKAYGQELEKTTVLIPITRIDEGRVLRTMVEGSESSTTEEIGNISKEAREAFAQIVDNLRDYNDVRHAYSMSQRLEVDRHIDEFLNAIKESGSALGAGLRHHKVSFRSDAPSVKPMDWTSIFLIIAPNDYLPAQARVPKQFSFAFG
jgi:transcriptional regulator with XRE-family HTH domain